MVNKARLNFWDERADLGDVAGTNDFLLKQLELDLLVERVPQKSHVLDVGCGNGETLALLQERKQCSGVGIDFSQNMIKAATQRAINKQVNKHLHFEVRTLQSLRESNLGPFDCAISERSLQNLDSEEEQYQAFVDILALLKPGGRYYMIESCLEGLEGINELRESFGLEAIQAPWHNCFFREDKVIAWADSHVELEEIVPFSSTYYLLSRVVYAKVAEQEDQTLQYDSLINQISMKLPVLGNFGPTRLWQWRKIDSDIGRDE